MLLAKLDLEARQNRGRVTKIAEETTEKVKKKKLKHKKGPKKFNVHVNAAPENK